MKIKHKYIINVLGSDLYLAGSSYWDNGIKEHVIFGEFNYCAEFDTYEDAIKHIETIYYEFIKEHRSYQLSDGNINVENFEIKKIVKCYV